MNKKILIIEDDQEMCRELNEIFTDLGYSVKTSFDGLSGKKILKKNKFDIIVLDLKLPNYNGYQILNYINKKKINSKVIVISARMKIYFEDFVSQDNEQEEDDLLKSADLILIKPFKINDLINGIKKIQTKF